jgi:phosphatidylethanolamine/phosphatidyl-N-methylethanolamine N-methyltransferase
MANFHVLGEFVRRPTSVGAVAPSSRGLAELITDVAEVDRASMIVEFGPGTGAFTEAILRKKPVTAAFFAIEANESFADATRARFPGLDVVHGSATAVHAHLEARGRASCDCIVSGLPFASFTPALQDALLAAASDVLVPGGRFVTFAYLTGSWLPRARRFRRRLMEEFSDVGATHTIWRNLPPAYVYRAVK